MKITIEDLKNVRFFDDYTDDQLKIFIGISSIKEFKVKDVLFEQYDELKEIYILLSGCLSLGISIAKEKRIRLGTLEDGQLFSWSAVFSPYISTAWVMALVLQKFWPLMPKNSLMSLKKIVNSDLKQCQKLPRQFLTV
jgi:cAMP-binding proteins - catabolite gene activator and regulatory subunit of cAMP-dependent protein kinases